MEDATEEDSSADGGTTADNGASDNSAADTEDSQTTETVEEDTQEEASQPADTTPSAPAEDNSAAQEDQSQASASEDTTEDVSYNSSVGEAIVAYAKQFIGNPYVYGGNSLTNGIDCSGFTQQIYAHFGYSLPRTSYDQAYVGTEVSWSESKAGDLIVYPGHVAILTGDGGIVHASNSAPYPKGGIKYTSNALYTSYITIRRIAE